MLGKDQEAQAREYLTRALAALDVEDMLAVERENRRVGHQLREVTELIFAQFHQKGVPPKVVATLLTAFGLVCLDAEREKAEILKSN